MEQPKNTTDAKFAGTTLTPEVVWAQRSSKTEAEKNHIFLSINVPDVDPKAIKLDVQATSLEFTGFSQSKKANYHVKLEFFDEIDPSATKNNFSSRALEFVLQKKKLQEEYWPRLLKDKLKVHFLKTDFDKWVDEDEQDAIQDDDDYMSRMGGMGGGMGGDGGFGGIDFSKLGGGAGGLGGGFGGDLGGDDDDEGDEDDEEDEEMPKLGDAKDGAKITEVE